MNHALHIGHNDLKLFLRDRGNFIWLFFMPVLFVWFFGMAFQGNDNDPANPKPHVLIDNRDTGFIGGLLIQALDDSGLTVVSPDDEDRPYRGIRIPGDFTAKIQQLEPVKVTLFQVDKGSEAAHTMIEVRLFRAILALTSNLIEAGASQPDTPPFDRETIAAMMAREPLVPLDVSFAGRRQIPSGFQQSLPGMLVMFLLINLLTLGGTSIAQERAEGVMRRMGMNPVPRLMIVAGKIYGRILLAIVQIAAVFLAGKFLFNMDISGNLLALAAVLAVFSWGCAALGVLLGAVIKTSAKVVGLSVLIGNIMAGIGGCWWPMEIVPDTVRTVAHAFPTAWAMDGLHQVISFGGSWAQIATECWVLAAFAVLFTALAGKFLRY